MRPGQKPANGKGWSERRIRRTTFSTFAMPAAGSPPENTAQHIKAEHDLGPKDGTFFKLPETSFLQSIQVKKNDNSNHATVTLVAKAAYKDRYSKLSWIRGVSDANYGFCHSYHIETSDITSESEQKRLWEFLHAADDINPIRQGVLNRIAEQLGITPPPSPSLEKFCLETIFYNPELRRKASIPEALPIDLAEKFPPLAMPKPIHAEPEPLQVDPEPLSFPRRTPKPQTHVSLSQTNTPPRTPSPGMSSNFVDRTKSPVMRTGTPTGFIDRALTPSSRTNTPTFG